MKETLQIHHIAKRLPYGLKIIVKSFFHKEYISEKWGIKNCSDYPISIFDEGRKHGKMLSEVKPILFPLSCLIQEITANGETFVPIERIREIYSRHEVEVFKYLTHPLELNIRTEKYSQDLDLYDGVSIHEFLLKNHIDTDSLIEKGLAISVLDLGKNPYA